MPVSDEHLSPYSTLPLASLARVDAYVSIEDKNFIRSIDPGMGALNFLSATLFHSIVQECKANGITYYSPDNIRALNTLIRHRAATRLTSPRLLKDGSSSPTSVHPKSAGAANKPTNLRQSPAQGVGGRGVGSGGKRTKQTTEEASSS